MTNSDRARQLELAVRRNRGKQIAGRVLADVGRVIARSVSEESLLSLDQTDELAQKLARRVEACYRRDDPCAHVRANEGDATSIFAPLARFGHQIADEAVAWFGKHSQDIGAVRLSAGEVLANVEELIALDGDDVRVISLDGRNGLLLDYSDHAPNFELWLWGQDWLPRFALGGIHTVGP